MAFGFGGMENFRAMVKRASRGLSTPVRQWAV
jgi:hypothetical protein